MPLSRSSILALDGTAFARLSASSRTAHVRRLLQGDPGKRARRWLGARLSEPAGRAVLDRLAGEGRIAELLHEIGSHRQALYPALAGGSPALRVAAAKSLLSLPKNRTGRLAVHRFLDRVRGEGGLAPLLRAIGPLALHDPWVRDIVHEATPAILPLVIAHRGVPRRHPENTMPSLKAAARAKADGVEIDVSLTRDGHLALWHDANPRSIDAEGRRRGGEKGMLVRPVFPRAPHLRVTHLLTLAELRRHYGYAKRTNLSAPRLDVTIPTLADVAAWLTETPSMRRVYVDLKLPAQSVSCGVLLRGSWRSSRLRFALASS